MTTALVRLEDTPQRVAEPCWFRLAAPTASVTEVWVQRPDGLWSYRVEDADGRTLRASVLKRPPFVTLEEAFA